MISAKELQLGDWVLYHSKPARVRNIHDNVLIDGDDELVDLVFPDRTTMPQVDPIHLDPIPLTTEILEKNFQEFLPGINLMYQLKGPYCLMDEDRQWVFGLLKVDGENSAGYPLVKISFVHQLQNALQLCGIEHEITL